MRVQPFNSFAETWIFTGDEGVAIAPGRFGEWAIHRLLEKEPSDSIVAAFQREVKRNRASYDELLPVFGIAIDKTMSLADGVSIDRSLSNSSPR